MTQDVHEIDAELEQLLARATFLRMEKQRIAHGIEAGAVFVRGDKELTIASVDLDDPLYGPCARGTLIEHRYAIPIAELKSGDWERKAELDKAPHA